MTKSKIQMTNGVASKPLTDKQSKLLRFIEKYQISNGGSPTLREMRERMKVSSDNSILKLLHALEEKGYIQKDGTPRGIKMLNSVRERLENVVNSFKLPVLGMIPAGGPVLTEEYVTDYVNVGEDLVYKPESWLLKVKGNSMIDAGIMDGDTAIVCSSIEPNVFDIVVALIDNENTLKRLVKENGTTYLRAENPDYHDLIPMNELQVQGVVTGIIRKYK
ncbi:MAG: LexA family transcriptional repressor, repressor LexA [Candidatus Peregrinibacteria bacterium GW2011_GWF2_38_29]|nr:MAG: LexA family transcriptional repressor, repressor LexA [Candidatus Peregrinibacteria bacterium GW2011_GWF2_38_29]HBB02478.1 repressor LexA [Candidatus Peregrinibacteria bacterium]